ncbi:hypothetical protein ABPG72_003431 [Tetrahymena utriculariae]
MLLNSTKKFGQLLLKQSRYINFTKKLTSIPQMRFCQEPPQGFRKFDRRRRGSSNQRDQGNQKNKEQNDKKNEQTIEPEEQEQQKHKDQQQNEQQQQQDDNKKQDQTYIGRWKERLSKEIQKRDEQFQKNFKDFKNSMQEQELNKSKQQKSDDDNNNEKKSDDHEEKEKKDEKKEDQEETASEGRHNKSKKDKKHKSHKKNEQQPDNLLRVEIPVGRALIYGGLAFVVFNIASEFLNNAFEIDYKAFVKDYLEPGLIQKIYIYRDNKYTFHIKTYAVIVTKDGAERTLTVTDPDCFLENLEIYQKSKGIQQENMIAVEFKYATDIQRYLYTLRKYSLSMLIIALIFFSNRFSKGFLKDMNPSLGENVIKEFGVDSKIKTKFSDVAGQAEAKKEVMEFVDFLKNPSKYEGLGAKMPKGALLTGPPGTGKTLLAKACAGESGVPFFFMSGSDFVQMYVGVGSSRVRQLFEAAKKKSPSIIFIDEIDAVGRKRDDRGGGSDERANTLNQLLVEMDGFSTDSKVIVFAATNRKELLDPALVRPGRFDRLIEITNPDIEGRKEIFIVHLTPLKIDPSKTVEEIAKRLATLTPGFSGADIMNLCNEAAILAARQNKEYIEAIDFEMASERVMAGLEKKSRSDEQEMKVIAVHESGHAVCSWFLEGGDPLLKLTIIPRTKGSLGYAQYLPNESSLQTKEELLDRICCILGGRVAEEIFFNKITTGAYDDLEKIYKMAHAIVTKYGMSDRIGNVGLKEGDFLKSYSNKTNRIVDEEISLMIKEQTERTRQIIQSKKDFIQKLSDALLEKKTLDLSQIKAILGERPFSPKSNYKAYLECNEEQEKEKQKIDQEQQEEQQQQPQQQQQTTPQS